MAADSTVALPLFGRDSARKSDGRRKVRETRFPSAKRVCCAAAPRPLH